MSLLRHCSRLRFTLTRAFLRTLFAVEHIGAGDMVFAVAHHRQFNLVLDIFDMEGAAGRLTTHQGINHTLGERSNLFAHARGGGALSAVDGDERLGHGNGDFRRLEADD